MTEPARYDPPVKAFIPDVDLVSRAQRAMMAAEDDVGDAGRLIRQCWEQAFGGVKVALDALRQIHPSERDSMTPVTSHRITYVVTMLTWSYSTLDDMSADLIGEVMHGVLTGRLTTHEQLDALGVPE